MKRLQEAIRRAQRYVEFQRQGTQKDLDALYNDLTSAGVADKDIDWNADKKGFTVAITPKSKTVLDKVYKEKEPVTPWNTMKQGGKDYASVWIAH